MDSCNQTLFCIQFYLSFWKTLLQIITVDITLGCGDFSHNLNSISITIFLIKFDFFFHNGAVGTLQGTVSPNNQYGIWSKKLYCLTRYDIHYLFWNSFVFEGNAITNWIWKLKPGLSLGNCGTWFHKLWKNHNFTSKSFL